LQNAAFVEHLLSLPAPDAEESNSETRSVTRIGKFRLKSLEDLDGRTTAARRTRDLVAGLESDLGGADRLTTGMRELVKRIAIAGAVAEDIEVRWLDGGRIDVSEYSTLINTQRRLLATIGLERRPHDVTPTLEAYAEMKREGALP
jgi:hypothetical protein